MLANCFCDGYLICEKKKPSTWPQILSLSQPSHNATDTKKH
jgi:hypothetical protein